MRSTTSRRVINGLGLVSFAVMAALMAMALESNGGDRVSEAGRSARDSTGWSPSEADPRQVPSVAPSGTQVASTIGSGADPGPGSSIDAPTNTVAPAADDPSADDVTADGTVARRSGDSTVQAPADAPQSAAVDGIGADRSSDDVSVDGPAPVVPVPRDLSPAPSSSAPVASPTSPTSPASPTSPTSPTSPFRTTVPSSPTTGTLPQRDVLSPDLPWVDNTLPPETPPTTAPAPTLPPTTGTAAPPTTAAPVESVTRPVTTVLPVEDDDDDRPGQRRRQRRGD